MKCKCYLILGTDKLDIKSPDCLDVSSLIKNLDEIKLSYSRVEYGGIVRKFASKLEFVAEARDRLVDYYLANRLHSKAAFGVYGMNDNWEYNQIFDCPLDFSSFTFDSYTAKIECMDNSVASVLKANGNTKYSIPVADVSMAPVKLRFDGIRLLNMVRFVFAGTSDEGGEYTYVAIIANDKFYYFPPVSYAENNIQVESVVLNDQVEGYSGNIDKTVQPNDNRNSYFLEARQDMTLSFDFTGLRIEAKSIMGTAITDLYLSLFKIPVNEEENPGLVFRYPVGSLSRISVDISRGEKLQVALSRTPGTTDVFGTAALSFYSGLCNTEWRASGEISYIDVIKPVTLLNRILEDIGLQNVDASIDLSDSNSVYLVAGESIRQFENAKIHTSFSDFCKFMEVVYGMVYLVEEQDERTSVNFVPRSRIFTGNLIKRLEVRSEPSYSVSAQRIYSEIKAGYEKQDYDLGNNGKDEFNTEIIYSSDADLRTQTLDFLCPYRADSYGFQELARKAFDEKSSSSSDDNTFIIDLEYIYQYLTINRATPVEGVFTDTVFNASLAPPFLIKANESYLASFTSKLKYASSSVMDSIYVDGEKVNRDILLDNPMFRQGDISVSTNDMVLPENWNGYVEFDWDNRTYRGYLSGLDINVGKDSAIKYELIEC